MNRFLIHLLLTNTLLITAYANAGVVIGGTRLVYHGDTKEASIEVKSAIDDKFPYLIQSFVDANGPKGEQLNTNKLPFIVTPPLFRLDAGTENTVRVVRAGGNLPNDRESVYWLNIKAIPASNPADKGKNELRFSLKNRIKLFYRPDGLGDPTMEDMKKIRFSQNKSMLTVSNPTAWYMSFYKLTVGNRTIDTRFMMVPPKNSLQIEIPDGAAGNISWQYINDYGAASPIINEGN